MLTCFFGIEIKASCEESSYDDAKNVKVYYKLYQTNYIPLKIFVENITENIYVKVFESLDDSETTYKYSDTAKGTLSFDFYYVAIPVTYKVDVYAAKNECKDKLVETYTIETAQYNIFSQYKICEENEDYYLCKRFLVDKNISNEKLETMEFTEFSDDEAIQKVVGENNLDGNLTEKEIQTIIESEFEKQINKHNTTKDMNTFEIILYYVKRYWIYGLIPILVISAIFIVNIIINKKRSKK